MLLKKGSHGFRWFPGIFRVHSWVKFHHSRASDSLRRGSILSSSASESELTSTGAGLFLLAEPLFEGAGPGGSVGRGPGGGGACQNGGMTCGHHIEGGPTGKLGCQAPLFFPLGVRWPGERLSFPSRVKRLLPELAPVSSSSSLLFSFSLNSGSFSNSSNRSSCASSSRVAEEPSAAIVGKTLAIATVLARCAAKKKAGFCCGGGSFV